MKARKNGNWSDNDTWDLLRVPEADDDIDLDDFDVDLDIPAPPVLSSLTGGLGRLRLAASAVLQVAEIIGSAISERELIKIEASSSIVATTITGGATAPAILADTSSVTITGTKIGGETEEAYAVKAVNATNLETIGNHIATAGRALGHFGSGILSGVVSAKGDRAKAAIYKDGSGPVNISSYTIAGSDNTSENEQYGMYISDTSCDITLDDGLIVGGEGGINSAAIYNDSAGEFVVDGNIEAAEASPPIIGMTPTLFNANKNTGYIRFKKLGKKYGRELPSHQILRNIPYWDTTGIRDDANPSYVLEGHSYGDPDAPASGTIPVVDASNVVEGVSFGVGELGTFKVPDPEHIRLGTGNGTCVVPPDSDIRYGSGSGTLRIPPASDVLLNIPIDNTLGTLRIPSPYDVLLGVPVNDSTGLLPRSIATLFIFED